MDSTRESTGITSSSTKKTISRTSDSSVRNNNMVRPSTRRSTSSTDTKPSATSHRSTTAASVTPSTTSTRSSRTASARPPGTSTRSSTNSSVRSSASSSTNTRDKSTTGKMRSDGGESKPRNKPSTAKTSNRVHPCHPAHPLEEVDGRYPYKCDGCKMRGAGRRYSCRPCNYNLHRDCMNASSKLRIQGHECQFYRRPLRCHSDDCRHGDFCRSCDACGMTVEGFEYHCRQTRLDFHPPCAKLQSEIRVGDVIFRLEKQGPSRCLKCQKKQLQGTCKSVPGWSYVSNHNGYSFHVHCLMEMVIENSSSNVNNGSSTSALHNVELPLQLKSKGSLGSSSSMWVNVFESFLKIVLVTLTGAHPATLLVSLVGLGIKEVLEVL